MTESSLVISSLGDSSSSQSSSPPFSRERSWNISKRQWKKNVWGDQWDTILSLFLFPECNAALCLMHFNKLLYHLKLHDLSQFCECTLYSHRQRLTTIPEGQSFKALTPYLCGWLVSLLEVLCSTGCSPEADWPLCDAASYCLCL